MSHIRIGQVAAEGSTLQCDLDPSPDLARFFTGEPFRVEYDRSVEDVPEGVLGIPVLANVCPVAWANGADVYVDAVDATFARALADVKASLFEMHDFLEGGTLYARRTSTAGSTGGERAAATAADGTERESDPAEEVEENPDERGSTSALLFTGGVDSTCSYVRHREEDPVLVSIRGWTITQDSSDAEAWAHLREHVSAFADARGLETAFIETNALSALDHAMLLAHYKRHVEGAWYSSVGHGLGLLGLCAPMAFARGIEDLYVAATHWEGVDIEWGSSPDVDDRVRWSGTRCHHDGYHLTRQERLDVVADYVAREDPTVELQTCNRRTAGNCGECEKCYRTAVGLRLAGLDPNAHGYPFSDDDYETVRRGLEEGRWELGENERNMWADIRDRVRERAPESSAERAFFEWLRAADIDELVAESGSPLTHRLLRAGARNAPTPVYNVAYPTLKSLRAGIDRVRSR